MHYMTEISKHELLELSNDFINDIGNETVFLSKTKQNFF